MFCAAFSTPRDRANLQLSNRRLERKVKELVMQVDDEHLSLTDQKDQVRAPLPSLSRECLCPRPGHAGCVCRVPCSTHPTDVLAFSVRRGCLGSRCPPPLPGISYSGFSIELTLKLHLSSGS